MNTSNEKIVLLDSNWNCYLFGSSEQGIVYHPIKGDVPNWFIRWMMKVCLGCTWVKKIKNDYLINS